MREMRGEVGLKFENPKKEMDNLIYGKSNDFD